MLNIHFGRDTLEEGTYIINPLAWFSNNRKVQWFNDPFVRKMIKEIDNAEVIRDEAILKLDGHGITPEQLAGGTQTLICIYKNPDIMFMGSTMGDNCVPLLMQIADIYRERDINVLLEHYMTFRDEDYGHLKIDGKISQRMDYLNAFGDFSDRWYPAYSGNEEEDDNNE